ncbi:hypothetical protein TanjilG_04501 [Lupinus angustifolius]|uniref:Uncharacterized protein n=1 Tax=Lupinus angustifolius TaxID=3871 RepID=A0A4P1RQP8_LUPAN|nr:PREDICTED: uncharacterized protein LOC109342973 [Lupinus angustifolius]OIW15966.1 hypothetical protein TanjilG_04501 [Lupinus angustifolius]
MKIEQCTPLGAKKLWNILRIVFKMMRKGIAKSKIIMDFNFFLRRGKLVIGKVIAKTLMLHYHYIATFACYRSDISFISPQDYEFSCSNSPTFPLHKHNHHYQHHRYNRSFTKFSKSYQYNEFSKSYQYNEFSTINVVQKVFEMLNDDDMVEASPLVALPGFGKSPIGRQLRITDSPFHLKDEGDHGQVDMAAEEFIKRFYKDLNLQKKMAAIESPHHTLWDT